MLIYQPLLVVLLFSIAGCTTGHLEYLSEDGTIKTACETEYSFAPSVDKFAVEYVLAYCAKQAKSKGYKVVNQSLLTLDLTLPAPPNNLQWTFVVAKSLYQNEKLTNKQYGYIIAFLDLQKR